LFTSHVFPCLTSTAADEPALDSAPEKKKREYKDMEEKHEGDTHARVDLNTVSIILSVSTIITTTWEIVYFRLLPSPPPRLLFS
jgi:hypothetical protein